MGEIADSLTEGFFYVRSRPPKSKGPGPCPRCGKPTRLREGANGKFYGCRDFPECKGNRDYVKGAQ